MSHAKTGAWAYHSRAMSQSSYVNQTEVDVYEFRASQDALGKEKDGNKDVEIAQTVPGERHPNAPGRWNDERRHIVPQRVQWALLLLTMACLVLLSACELNPTGASGSHSPTATTGLSGTLAAAATAQAAASASDHPSTVF